MISQVAELPVQLNPFPPATNTVPFWSTVADWFARTRVEKFPVCFRPPASSYISNVPPEASPHTLPRIRLLWGATVTVVEPQIEPAQAVMVADPAESPYAWPRLLSSLVMVATALLEELQVAEARICVPPPLKVPVAVKPKDDPRGTHGFIGLKAIESKSADVGPVGWYSSALEREPVFHPPAIRTIPLFNSVSVWELRAVFILPVALKVPVEGL